MQTPASPLFVFLNKTHRLAISLCERSATRLNNCPHATSRVSEVDEWSLAVALLTQRVPHTHDEASGSVSSMLFITLLRVT